MNESIRDNTYDLVEEVINERVDDHLMSMRCRIALETMIDDIILSFINDDYKSMYEDIEIDITGKCLLYECIDDIIDSFVNDIG